MTVKVPIDVVITTKSAEDGSRKAKRSLQDIREAAQGTRRANVELNDSFSHLGRGIAAVDGPLGGIASRFNSLRGLFNSTNVALGGFVVALAGSGFAIRNSINLATEFSSAMAEVNTLVGDDFAFQKLTKSVRELSKEFGQAPTDQAKAAYQIISAGASSAAEAVDILTASNKLAIGGVTNVATAADGLTTILNAYGESVGSATDVSDALFVAMRAGKTTIEELSSSVGRVAPLAAQAGTSLEELLSATAALTKGGISTAESMTGLRAIMAAIAKPSSEAADLAAQLGIEFNASGLAAKGFAGFLEDLREKTGGNTEQLAQLFGGVEALVPVMALTGKAADDFTEVLEGMGVKAGETEAAFAKMAESPQFKFDQLRAKFTDLGISIGNALLTVIVPATQILIDNFEDLTTLGEALAVVIGVRLAGALTVATAKLVINTGALIANQVQMARLAATVGGTSTAFVLFSGAATTAAKGLAILAGPLAIGAAVGAYFFLKGRVESATEAFNSFMATMLVLGGGFVKLANYATIPARAIVESFTKAFSQTQRLFDAFVLDVRDFFRNPFDNDGLARTQQALSNLFSFGALDSVKQAVKDVQSFNETIDAGIDEQLVEWGRQNRAAAEENDEFGTTTEDTTAKLEELFEQLNNTGGGLDKTTEKTTKATKAIKDLKTASDAATNAVKRAGERIFDVFADTIDDALGGDLKSWKDYGGRIVDVMRETFSNIAALALAKPVIVPLIGAAGQALGLDSGSLDQLGGSFGVNGLSDLVSNGGSILQTLTSGLNTPIFSSGSMVGGAIDSVGQFLGIGGQTLPGPTLSGAAGYTGGLSTAFTPGSSLAGFGGTMLSSVLGLSGEYSGITGTAGSIAGTILGSAIGMPWLGAFAGGFLGDALGGLFGGGRPHPAANVAVNEFGSLGEFSNSSLNYKHLTQEDAAQFQGVYGSYFQSLAQATGADLSVLNNPDLPEGGFNFAGGVDDGTGFLSFGTGDKDKYYSEVTFDPNDEDAMQKALGDFAKIAVERIDAMGGEVSERLLNMLDMIETEGRSAEDVINDIAFISNWDKFFADAEEPMTNAQLALQTINDNFDTMAETATRLGFSLDELNRLEDKRTETIKNTRDALFQASASDYLDVVAPGVNEFRALFDNYQAKIREFESIGLDTTFIDRTFQVQQEKLLQTIISDTYADRISALEDEADQAERLVSSYAQISESLGTAILNLRLSEISPLSTEQRLSEARSNFINVANRAANGDVDAMDQLASLGDQFLAISRDYYASTDEFVSDFQLVEQALKDAQAKADQQLNVQQQLVNLAQQEIEAINNMASELAGALQEQQRVTSIINSALQVSKNNANETLVQGIRGGLISEEQFGQILPIFNQLGAPSGDGVGGRSLFFESNPAANAAFIQAMRSLGIPGFDTGGDVLANSLFMVGEKRPEVFQAGASGGKVIPIQNGAEVEQRLMNLENEMRASVRIQQEGYKRLEGALLKQIEATEENTQAVKRSGT